MQIAVALFPGFTALDALGPYQVLAHLPGSEVVFVAERPGPVADNSRLTVTAHAGYDDVPDPDVVVVAGGLAALDHADPDGRLAGWVRQVHPRTRWTASVCTGALILGAAGLLRGRRATTHWHFLDRLRSYDAEPVGGRYVLDGRVATAAGVSAGIDLALALAGRLADETTAQLIQLDLEYAPEPPFTAGSPRTAPDDVVAHLASMYDAALPPGRLP